MIFLNNSYKISQSFNFEWNHLSEEADWLEGGLIQKTTIYSWFSWTGVEGLKIFSFLGFHSAQCAPVNSEKLVRLRKLVLMEPGAQAAREPISSFLLNVS